MQLHVILKLKLKLSAQNKYKFKIWILELIKSFVSGSSRDESQLVGNVSEDVVTKSIIIHLFIHQIKWFSDGFHIFKGHAVILFIP